MRLTFLVPSSPLPTGGAIAIFEFANGMARRGHEVDLWHLDLLGEGIHDLREITYVEFDPRLRHHVPDQFDVRDLPSADFVFCFDGRVPIDRGLPLMFVQGFRVLPEEIEVAIYGAHCPRICISTWLQQITLLHGASPQQAVHIPYGVDHEKFQLLTDVSNRPNRIAMYYNRAPTKRSDLGFAAIRGVQEILPDTDAVIFGMTVPTVTLPERSTFVLNPPHTKLVADIYNGSSVFVSSSQIEGFGLASVEAMSCGCALATTDSGGASDYARHCENALVSPAGDLDGLVANIVTLLRDDDCRKRLSDAARRCTAELQWDRSAALLEAFLEEYGSDPDAYRHPVGPLDPCYSGALRGFDPLF